VKIKLRSFIATLCVMLLLVMGSLSAMASVSYPGNLGLFFIFCIVFLLAWILAWFGYRSYFYMLFSSFCLLGFWMKACAHLSSGREFVEPIGAFDGSAGAWDKAILVGLVAGLGMLIFRIAQMLLMHKFNGTCVIQKSAAFVPKWYFQNRKWIWLTTLVLIVIVSIVNFKLGINQAGLLPKHHLPFKLNAIIIWCLYSAFAFWMASLVWWDVCLGLGFKFEALVFEGVLSSITILSRSLYVTHVFHYLFSIFFNKDSIEPTLRKTAVMLLTFIVGMAIVLISVAELRKEKFYGEVNTAEVQSSQKTQGMASTQFFLLLSERWIGLEGVMSTSSYSGVGIDLFKQGWLDTPSYERKPIYEQVANSIYISPDYPNAAKYNFLSTPGLAAMLHLSGSLLVVGFGFFLLLAIFSFGEYLIFTGLQNPFVLSLYGMIIAMMLHQFGGLYVNLIQVFEITCMMVFLWILTNAPKRFVFP
jgi:hypothetical protein